MIFDRPLPRSSHSPRFARRSSCSCPCADPCTDTPLSTTLRQHTLCLSKHIHYSQILGLIDFHRSVADLMSFSSQVLLPAAFASHIWKKKGRGQDKSRKLEEYFTRAHNQYVHAFLFSITFSLTSGLCERERESGRERHVMSMPKQNQKYVYRPIPKLEMQLHVKYTLITLIMYSHDNIYPSKWMDQIIIYYLRWHLYSRAEARKANYWKLDYEVHVTAVPSGQPDITIFPMCNLFYPDAGILLSFHF